MANIKQLSPTLFLVDTFDLGMSERTSAFIIKDDKIALIETASSPSIPHILKAFEELNIPLNKVDYLILTHIHLDHAGGAGLFMEECPNAKLYVHPKGARHIIDPSRLIASARSIYGEKFDMLYNPILPVSPERVVIIEDGSTLCFGQSNVLFYHTRGHADHHISMLESSTNGLFVGDTTGVFYPQLKDEEVHLIIPSTSPNQFDPNLMEQSIQLFERLNASQLYFGHYGVYQNPSHAYSQVRYWLPIFLAEGKNAMAEKDGFSERASYLEKRLFEHIVAYLRGFQIPDHHPVYQVIKLDVNVSAMGIIDYLTKQQK